MLSFNKIKLKKIYNEKKYLKILSKSLIDFEIIIFIG